MPKGHWIDRLDAPRSSLAQNPSPANNRANASVGGVDASIERFGSHGRPNPPLVQTPGSRRAYARDSSRPSRAAYRLVTRRRRASGDGHSATSAPQIPSAPPIQIHATNGDTMKRKSAGGGFRV